LTAETTKGSSHVLSVSGPAFTQNANNDSLASGFDPITQLAQLTLELKNALAFAEGQTGVPSSQNASATAEAVPLPLASTSKTTLSLSAEADKLNPLQSVFAIQPSTAQPNSSPAAAQGNELVEALTNSTKDGGDANFHSGADFTSGDNTSFTAHENFGAGLSAEGIQATGTYNFASTLSAFRAANGGAAGLPSVVDQVILQMNRGVKGGNDQMSVQLQPADMGKITVKLDFGSDGQVRGTVTADNPKTLDILQKDSRSLERALQDAGLRADSGSLQFNLSGQNNQAGQMANQGTKNTTLAADGTISAEDMDNGALADINAAVETYYVTPTSVNIRV
jgi:hypothetical protein